MKLKPNGSRILVLPDEAMTKTEQGVIIAPTAAIQKPTGVVVAVGSEVKAEKSFKVGDVVLFTRYTATEVDLDGVTHLLFDAEDILGTVA